MLCQLISAQGFDTKTDDKQVTPGKFLSLENSIFTKGGLLQKRNGFAFEPRLPDNTSTFLTTFNGNLTAIGDDIKALSAATGTWVEKGAIQPVELSVLPVIRSNTNQSQADSAVSPNGLLCTTYTDNMPSGGMTTPVYKYVITDSTTGQNIVAPTVIAGTGITVTTAARVFLLGNYFVIVFEGTLSSISHLFYIAISVTNPSVSNSAVSLSAAVSSATTLNFDGVVANNNLYLAWNGNDGGGAIRLKFLTSTLVQSNTVVFSGYTATIMSVAADISGGLPVIYASFYDSGSTNGFTLAVDHSLLTILAPTATITSETVSNITSVATAGVCSLFWEIVNFYSYDGSVQTDYINKNTITSGGVLGSETTMVRDVGLASKAFTINGTTYMLTVQSSTYQPTYFLLNSLGQVISKLAYSNGGGYNITGLPNASINGDEATISYLYKDSIAAVNKSMNAVSTTGIYSQTGVNVVNFTLTTSNIVTAEIGQDLMITGGFLWMYDGYAPVENNFHIWPEDIGLVSVTGSGNITAQEYFYQVTYEWADNQGNVYRSAPSVPVSVTTTTANSTNTLYIPTLRLTYKLANPVKICVYRWSQGQQIFYQVTSINAPLLNDPTVDSVSFVDTFADSSIIGNNILYTTGGVLEDIGGPASNVITLFNNRLWLVDAEDPNLLWYSKQVIENTPVEMSDLLTLYVAPTTSAQGSTGPTLAAAPMDDKLCLFKENAIYYINGIGPDNTGANSQYSDAVFITSTIGCANQHSIVFMPQGLMFQSDKGIWLLDRGLNTSYIGAPVEKFTTGAKVLSALNIPATNQVRFTMDSGMTLMYDYFYGQWGTFVGIPGVASTLYQELHTFINAEGEVFQETPGAYIDGSNPVLMQFTTSWLNLAGLQGYERAYFFYILGTYMSPHQLQVQVAYDYEPTPSQSLVITPDNASAAWGGEELWGSGAPWGGPGNIEQWRVFFNQGKTQAFQISIQEIYDAALVTIPGAGFTLSGLNVIYGGKKSYTRNLPSKRYTG